MEPALQAYCHSRWNGYGEDVLSEAKTLFLHQFKGNYHIQQIIYFGRLKAMEAARNLGLYRTELLFEDVTGLDDQVQVPESDLIDLIERKERTLMVLKEVSQLSKVHREVLYLRYWKDRTLAETAEALGMTLGKIYRHEQKAFAILRRILGNRSNTSQNVDLSGPPISKRICNIED